MIGIDTNILVRFLVVDDRSQHETARQFLTQRTSSDPAFISLMVVAELIWVLKRLYDYSFADIKRALSTLLMAEELEFEQRTFLGHILIQNQSSSIDLADHIISHIAKQNGCTHTVTFDRNAAKTVPGMELLA